MSKESSVPLTGLADVGDGMRVIIVPIRWRRYPITDSTVRKALNLDESGHNVPPASSRRRRRV